MRTSRPIVRMLLAVALASIPAGVAAETRVLTYNSGARYEGAVLNGQPHGYGTYFFAPGNTANKIKYVGQFHMGKRHGVGTLTFQRGDRYEGQFTNGDRTGYGKYWWPNGDRHEGDFVKDLCHGNGTRYHSDGRVYQGQWQNSKLHGQGKMAYPNKDTYVGTFANGERSGEGKYFHADGTKYVGVWKDNWAADGWRTYPDGRRARYRQDNQGNWIPIGGEGGAETVPRQPDVDTPPPPSDGEGDTPNPGDDIGPISDGPPPRIGNTGHEPATPPRLPERSQVGNTRHEAYTVPRVRERRPPADGGGDTPDPDEDIGPISDGPPPRVTRREPPAPPRAPEPTNPPERRPSPSSATVVRRGDDSGGNERPQATDTVPPGNGRLYRLKEITIRPADGSAAASSHAAGASQLGQVTFTRGDATYDFTVKSGSASATCREDGTRRFQASWTWEVPPTLWRAGQVVRVGGSASVSASGPQRGETAMIGVGGDPLRLEGQAPRPNPLQWGGASAVTAYAKRGEEASTKGYAEVKLTDAGTRAWSFRVAMQVTAGLCVEALYHYNYVEGSGQTVPTPGTVSRPSTPTVPVAPTPPQRPPTTPVVTTPPPRVVPPTPVVTTPVPAPPPVTPAPPPRLVPATPVALAPVPAPPPVVSPPPREEPSPPVAADTVPAPPPVTPAPSAPAVEPTSSGPPPEPVTANSLNARLALRMSVGLAEAKAKYDLSGDGRVTARDATLILQRSVAERSRQASQ